MIKQQLVVVRHVVAALMASLCISAITAGELVFGLATRLDAVRLHVAVEEFLRRVGVLPWDADVAKCYGSVQAGMERHGAILALLDLNSHARAGCWRVAGYK